MRGPVVRGEIPSTTVLWRATPTQWTCTVVAKATFLLAPGPMQLAPTQEAIVEADTYWDDDPRRSLSAANDLAPAKPKIDVLLVGHAFAPGARNTRSIVARLVAGTLDKSVNVLADRSAGHDGTILHGPKFARMPLRYERAVGGPKTWNPVGLRPDARDAYGRTTLPNVVSADADVAAIEPAGFGPIGPQWPTRLERLGRLAPTFHHDAWSAAPLPEGFDLAYFNCAPLDQRLDALRAGDPILLENLHRSEPVLATAVPGVEPSVTVRRDGRAEILAPRLDTVLFDTDRAIVSFTWRTRVELARREEPLELEVALVTPSKRAVTPQPFAPPAPSGGALPFSQAGAPSRPVSRLGALPFVEARSQQSPRNEHPTQQMPAIAEPSASKTAPPPPLATAQAQPPVPPPPSVPEPSWAAPAATPPPPAWQGAIYTPPAALAPAAVLAGAAAASNAATGSTANAAPETKRSRVRPSPAEILELVWFDPAATPRVKRHPEWKAILDDLESEEFDPTLDEEPLQDDAADGDDRREVFEVLTRGSPSGPDRIEHALVDAVRPDGRFAPRLMLVAGELTFEFDDMEVLKATLAAATPFATEEGELKRAVDRASDFLKSPGLVCAPDVARGFTQRIRDAFRASPRLVQASYLEDQTERALLDRRAYQRRTVFGEKHLRGETMFVGLTAGVPTYLPDALAKKLPMFRRFKLRMLAEAHHQEDQYEAHAAAFKPVAVARVVR